MIEKKIPIEDGKGFIKVLYDQDVEFVNPIEHFAAISSKSYQNLMEDVIELQLPQYPIGTFKDLIEKEAKKHWEEQYGAIVNTIAPENFYALLKSKSRKEQVKLLKKQGIDPNQLLSFIFKAWSEHGFTFSQYTSEILRQGIDKSDLPEFIHLRNGEIRKVGKTSLSDGQLKNLLEQRKVVISKFIDKGDTWHCFFLTYNSIGGKETWEGGQAHFHYISDKFGITRNEALKQLKSKNYPSTSVHIKLLDYGFQNDKTHS